MEPVEITLGQVTYTLRRVYTGDRPAAELILEQLSQNPPPDPSFDEGHTEAV